MNFGRQQPAPLSLDDERAMLQESRFALDRLKNELAERVEAVREREEELRRAIAEAERGHVPSPPGPRSTPARDDDTAENALELQRRERAVSEREQKLAAAAAALAAREQSLADRETSSTQAPARVSEQHDEREARIEARLTELKEAEKLFLRTREELAARSEAVAARERLVAQRERELDEVDDAPKRDARELEALEERLARLEQGQSPGEDTQSFTDGFRKLQQDGARQPSDARNRRTG